MQTASKLNTKVMHQKKYASSAKADDLKVTNKLNNLSQASTSPWFEFLITPGILSLTFPPGNCAASYKFSKEYFHQIWRYNFPFCIYWPEWNKQMDGCNLYSAMLPQMNSCIIISPWAIWCQKAPWTNSVHQTQGMFALTWYYKIPLSKFP